MTAAIEAGELLRPIGASLAEHTTRYGALPYQGGASRLVAAVQAAGLTGRGGAGFPTWRKLVAVAAGERPVVVANGAEGEPASAKDRTLLRTAPHLVLDGLQLAAECVGATRACLYLPAGSGAATAGEVVHRAIEERRRAGTDRIRVEVFSAPHRFVSGEESAVVSAIEGRPPVPRDRLRRVVDAGVRGRPTLVQNVETLAHIALIARYGPEWFRGRGTRNEPGVFLATISGAVATPGVYELPCGIPLPEALARAGGYAPGLQAVLVGGFHGAWLPPAAFAVPVSRAALQPWGASPGAGVLIALSSQQCGLVESARIASYLAGETAGQCGPCVNGLPRLADTVTRLARLERHPGLATEVSRLCTIVEGRGACHHPDGTVRLVRSSLAVFADEVRAHLAGTCTKA